MEDRLRRALEFSNYRQTIHIQRENVKQRYNSQLQLIVNGGIFYAERELIAFVQALIETKNETAIISDSKNNPVNIENLKEFRDNLLEAYHQASNELYTEHQRLKKSRNIKAIIEWKEDLDYLEKKWEYIK